jgi:hypothetical protein
MQKCWIQPQFEEKMHNVGGFKVRLDEVIRNFRGFAILSNSNDCI